MKTSEKSVSCYLEATVTGKSPNEFFLVFHSDDVVQSHGYSSEEVPLSGFEPLAFPLGKAFRLSAENHPMERDALS